MSFTDKLKSNPGHLYGDLGFTEYDELYSKITHEKFLEFLKKYPIVSSSRGNNNYGEFRFITVMVTRKCYDGSEYKDAVTFYGNGYHEYREYSPETWSFYVGNGCLYSNKQELNRKTVIEEIENERKGMHFNKTYTNNTFSVLADLMDEDGAYSELYG